MAEQVGDVVDQRCQVSIYPANAGEPTEDYASMSILAGPLHVSGS